MSKAKIVPQGGWYDRDQTRHCNSIPVYHKVNDEYHLVEPKIQGLNTPVKMEAWRNPKDPDGRTYAIYVIVTDKAGNETRKSTAVVCQ